MRCGFWPVGILAILSGIFQPVASQFSSGGSSAAVRLPGMPGAVVFAFRSNDLAQTPREIEQVVVAPNLNRIGLRVLFTRPDNSTPGEFLVVGVVN